MPSTFATRKGRDGGRWSDCVTSERTRILGRRVLAEVLVPFVGLPFAILSQHKAVAQHGGEESRTPNECPASVLIGFWVSVVHEMDTIKPLVPLATYPSAGI